MPKKRAKAPQAMLDEIQTIAKKYKWSGPIIVPREAAVASVPATSAECPPGQTLQTIQVVLPNGTTEIRKVCM